jgi:hypothetical protein
MNLRNVTPNDASGKPPWAGGVGVCAAAGAAVVTNHAIASTAVAILAPRGAACVSAVRTSSRKDFRAMCRRHRHVGRTRWRLESRLRCAERSAHSEQGTCHPNLAELGAARSALASRAKWQRSVYLIEHRGEYARRRRQMATSQTPLATECGVGASGTRGLVGRAHEHPFDFLDQRRRLTRLDQDGCRVLGRTLQLHGSSRSQR